MYLTQSEYNYICVISLEKNISLIEATDIYFQEVYDVQHPDHGGI